MQELPNFKRKEVLLYCANEIERRQDELLHALCVVGTAVSMEGQCFAERSYIMQEAGKPLKDAKAELGRAYDTFTIGAEEAIRQYGEYLPLDVSARNPGFAGIVRRFPVGLLSMITPFNFPYAFDPITTCVLLIFVIRINLVAHKVAPAIAAGCPFVLKPNGMAHYTRWSPFSVRSAHSLYSDLTPMGALLVGDILSKAGLPDGVREGPCLAVPKFIHSRCSRGS